MNLLTCAPPQTHGSHILAVSATQVNSLQTHRQAAAAQTREKLNQGWRRYATNFEYTDSAQTTVAASMHAMMGVGTHVFFVHAFDTCVNAYSARAAYNRSLIGLSIGSPLQHAMDRLGVIMLRVQKFDQGGDAGHHRAFSKTYRDLNTKQRACRAEKDVCKEEAQFSCPASVEQHTSATGE